MNSPETIKNLAYALRQAFKFADCPEDIEPVFREAAEGSGEGDGNLSPSTFQKGILPGFLDNFMADNVGNRVLKNIRKSSRNFSSENLRSIHIK